MCPGRICRYAERLGAEGLNRIREKMIYFIPFAKIASKTLNIYSPEYIADEGDEAEEDIGLIIIANKYTVRYIIAP